MCEKSPDGSNKLNISWSYSNGSQHRGEIDLKWLQENSYSPTSLRERHQHSVPQPTVRTQYSRKLTSCAAIKFVPSDKISTCEIITCVNQIIEFVIEQMNIIVMHFLQQHRTFQSLAEEGPRTEMFYAVVTEEGPRTEMFYAVVTDEGPRTEVFYAVVTEEGPRTEMFYAFVRSAKLLRSSAQ